MSSNNIFIGNDPLLNNSGNLESKMQELTALKALIEQKEQSLSQLKAQMIQPQQPQASAKTPVWDEIDSILQGLSDDEYNLLINNDEFKESADNIKVILEKAYMEMMRPIIEGSDKGKEALESHLALVKRLKKAASAEVSKQMVDFKEYTEKYSDMTYADYLKMKNGTLKSNKR